MHTSKDKLHLIDKINEFRAIFNQKGIFSNLNLWCAYFVRSKMSIKGINMFPGRNNTRLKRKILIILDFKNGFLPTYLPLCGIGLLLAWSKKSKKVGTHFINLKKTV